MKEYLLKLKININLDLFYNYASRKSIYMRKIRKYLF